MAPTLDAATSRFMTRDLGRNKIPRLHGHYRYLMTPLLLHRAENSRGPLVVLCPQDTPLRPGASLPPRTRHRHLEDCPAPAVARLYRDEVSQALAVVHRGVPEHRAMLRRWQAALRGRQHDALELRKSLWSEMSAETGLER